MKAQGVRSLIASVSSVLAIGLVVSLGTQPVDYSAVPMASVGQPAQSDFVSTAVPSLPDAPVALSRTTEAGVGLAAPDGSLIPEEAPGEDTTVLTVPTVVPTASVPSITPATVNPSSGTLLSMPLAGRKTSRFGMRFHPVRHVWKLHTGLDLAAPCGTPIGAAAAGTVVKAGWAGGNGVQVKVDHGTIAGHRVVTTYNHLSAIGVSVGQKVVPHQGVGRVGTTGFSTGCHLHFEVIVDGVFTNPEPWLNGSAIVVDTVGMGAGRPNEAVPALPSLPITSGPAVSPSPSATPTPSPSHTPSVTPSASASPTPSPTPTPTPSETPSASASPTPCVSPSANAAETPVEDPTPCTSVTPSPTPSPEDSGTPPDPTETPGETPEIPEDSPSPPVPGTPAVPTPSPTPTTASPTPTVASATPAAASPTTASPTPTVASATPAAASPTPSTASATPSTEAPPTTTQPSASEQESTPEA